LGFGLSGAAYWTNEHKKNFTDNLYASIKEGIFRLDIGKHAREYYYDGIYHRALEYAGLGISNGNIIYSGNARTLPGCNFMVEPFKVPFTNGIVKLYGNFADYKMKDNRYMHGARLHTSSLFANVKIGSRLKASAGLEDWAEWAGTDPNGNKSPSGFKDYIRVIFGRKGGKNASESDQINVLGNHLGRILCKLDYRGDWYKASIAMDHPYEDGSGTTLHNFPDAVWTIYAGANDKDRWISDAVFEFIYTKSQSGRYHTKPGTNIVIGGDDNYFNNGEYRSGWTYYGRTLGVPLITPREKNAQGMTLGVCNNRIEAYNMGIRGKIAHIMPYSLKLTYSKNYGMYNSTYAIFDSVPHQFSLGLDGELPHSLCKHIIFTYGLYADSGDLYKDCVALSLGMRLHL
jgi:hypothetical protein